MVLYNIGFFGSKYLNLTNTYSRTKDKVVIVTGKLNVPPCPLEHLN